MMNGLLLVLLWLVGEVERRRKEGARRDEKHRDRSSLWYQFGGPDQKLRTQHQIQSSWHVHTKHTNMHNVRRFGSIWSRNE